MALPDATTDQILARAREWIDSGRLPNGDAPMVVATVDAQGFPHARWVLLKEIDSGFVFYTNTKSAKGRELAANPRASLAFHWPSTGRQLRVTGTVEPASDAMADAYWRSRPRESQLASSASSQSETLQSRDELLAKFRELEAAMAGREVPRPPHWKGFRVVPRSIEFWTNGDHRLHHRERYTRSEGKTDSWTGSLLHP